MKKKLLSLLVAFLAVGTLSACGKTPGNKTQDSGKCDPDAKEGAKKCPTEDDCVEQGKTLENGGTENAKCVVPPCGNGKLDQKPVEETCDTGEGSPKKCESESVCLLKNKQFPEYERGVASAKRWVYSETAKGNVCTSSCKLENVTCSLIPDGVCLNSCSPTNDIDCLMGSSCVPGTENNPSTACNALASAGFGEAACFAVKGNGNKGMCVGGINTTALSPDSPDADCSVGCPVGSACGSPAVPLSRFIAFCAPKCTSNDECLDGFFCSTQYNLTEEGRRVSKGYSVCMPKTCDPNDENTCPTGMKCSPETYSCEYNGTGTKTAGSVCSSSSECAGGPAFGCFKLNGSGYCTQIYPSYSNASDCPNGMGKLMVFVNGMRVCSKGCETVGDACSGFPELSCQAVNSEVKSCLPKERVADVTNPGAVCSKQPDGNWDTDTSCGAGEDAICLASKGETVTKGYCSAFCYRSAFDKRMTVTCPTGYVCDFGGENETEGICLKECSTEGNSSDCPSGIPGVTCRSHRSLNKNVCLGQAS